MPDTLFDTSPIPKPETHDISLQLKCVGREIGYRRGVYKRRVLSKYMTQEEADYELGVMSAVYASLKRLKAIDEKRKADTEQAALNARVCDTHGFMDCAQCTPELAVAREALRQPCGGYYCDEAHGHVDCRES